MNIIDVEQGSPQWFAARCGLVTASRISDVVAKTKSGWSASRANYESQLVAERLTGEVQESFQSAAMLHGIECEPRARAAYEFLHDTEVVQVGFVTHPTILLSGASPDGFVGDSGLLEIKCPQSTAHIETLLSESIPNKYLLQMQWQMACTRRQWCDYVSFDPKMSAEMQLFVKRLHRDDVLIGNLEREVEVFLAEIDDTIERLTRRYRPQAVA